MRPFFPRPALLLVPALLLAACSKSGSPDAAPASPGPAVNYWSAIAPLVTGTYGGNCMRPPSTAPLKIDIVIAADGKVSAGDLRSDLRKADISLSSTIDNDKPVSGINAMQGDFTLMLADKGPQRGLVSMVASGDNAVACEQDMKAPTLRGMQVYPLVAKFVDTPARKISCIPTGAIKTEQVDYSLAAGVLTVNGETFDLNASRQQSVLFTDGLSRLFYSSTLPDGRLIKINLDAQGKLTGLEGKGKGDQLYACH
ncbi:MAG TPA: hypothetical protein VFS95_01295 [Telluria sp.]|nr:hypothetical protein [Telluria sp.]